MSEISDILKLELTQLVHAFNAQKAFLKINGTILEEAAALQDEVHDRLESVSAVCKPLDGPLQFVIRGMVITCDGFGASITPATIIEPGE
jgi:hypothetical protein